MAAIDFSEFHELVQQFKGEIPIKKVCEQEGVSYRSYLSWRQSHGLSPRRKKDTRVPEGLVELVAETAASDTVSVARVCRIHVEFENGLTFDREEMDVDALIDFLTKIRPALCSD